MYIDPLPFNFVDIVAFLAVCLLAELFVIKSKKDRKKLWYKIKNIFK